MLERRERVRIGNSKLKCRRLNKMRAAQGEHQRCNFTNDDWDVLRRFIPTLMYSAACALRIASVFDGKFDGKDKSKRSSSTFDSCLFRCVNITSRDRTTSLWLRFFIRFTQSCTYNNIHWRKHDGCVCVCDRSEGTEAVSKRYVQLLLLCYW